MRLGGCVLSKAAPVAMLVEQAGGRATDGVRDVLDIAPDSLHQRIPLVFGASEEISSGGGRRQLDLFMLWAGGKTAFIVGLSSGPARPDDF